MQWLLYFDSRFVNRYIFQRSLAIIFRESTAMSRAISVSVQLRIMSLVLVMGLLGAFWPLPGQEPKEASFRGRLPPYYSDIVTEMQRQQIYAVQEKYEKLTSALEDQLESLKKKRDIEIIAVLNDDQKSKLKRAQEEAAAKRKKAAAKRAADSKTAVK
jgi:hypothetical protein